MYVIDTSVLSGLINSRVDSGTERLLAQQLDNLFLAATTIYEVNRGLERLPRGRKREQYEAIWWDDILPLFSRRVLAIDAHVAELWARLFVGAERRGRTPPLLDCQIAAVAIAHGMTVVTRDRGGFAELGCELLLLA